MPDSLLKTWSVNAPDGTEVTFTGRKDMTPDAVIQRAQQEYAFKTGKIPTTYAAGRNQSIGETLADRSKPISAAVGLTGALTGQPEIVAAAPLVGRGVQAAGEYIAGRPITPTSVGEVATLAGEGALAGYGPQILSHGLESAAAKTVAHQLPNGQWVAGIKGSGVIPWGIRTAGEYAKTAADALHAGSKGFAAVPSALSVSESTDAIASDVSTAVGAVRSLIAKGAAPAEAVKQVTGGNPALMGPVMMALMQGNQIKPAQSSSLQPNPNDPSWRRADGSMKGSGFLGVIQRPDGKVSSEISIGVNIGGREVEIPTLVPTLSPQERDWLINNDVSDPRKIPASIIQKATDFARSRIAAGKSPFAQQGEQTK